MEKKYLGIDIGGTWIKGTVFDQTSFDQSRFYEFNNFDIKKIKSPLHKNAKPKEIIAVLKELIASFGVKSDDIVGIGISTPGIVNYQGTKVLKAAEHLTVLKTELWKTELEKQLQPA